jgi:hypothetical protein
MTVFPYGERWMTKPSARAAPLARATKERGRLAAAQADVAEIDAEVRDVLTEIGSGGVT